MAEGAGAGRKAANATPVKGSTVSTDLQAERANPAALDPIIHVRVRLGIVSALAVEESLTFNELKERLDTSDGNLSVHARRLEEAGSIVWRDATTAGYGRGEWTSEEVTAAVLERIALVEGRVGAFVRATVSPFRPLC